MKKVYYLFCITSLIFSCAKKENTEKQPQALEIAKVDTVSKEQAKEDSIFKEKKFEEYMPDFQSLVITNKGLVRGIDIGTTSKEVLKKETILLTTETKEKLVYMTELSNDESAEITYFLKDGKVDGMEYIIGQGSAKEVSSFILEFTDYFTSKYGPVIPKGTNEEVWKTPTGHEIDIFDISKDNQFGLKIIVKK